MDNAYSDTPLAAKEAVRLPTYDPAAVMDALEARGLKHSYPSLASYQSNIMVREHVIEKGRREWEATHSELLARLKEGHEVDRTLLRRMHVEQLDLLAHICMYVEDLAYVGYLLRHRLKSLDRSVYFNGTMRSQTLSEFAALPSRSIRARFRLPVIARLGLKPGDVALVSEAFRTCIAGLAEDISTVKAFSTQGHFDIYNEYKHTFDILLGMGALEELNIHTHIYARVAARPKEKRRERTLILDASREAIRRYQAVFVATSNLMNVLVQNTLSWMIYADGRYLVQIPSSYGLSSALLKPYASLVESYDLGWAVQHSLQLEIGFAPKAARAIGKAIAESGVAKRSEPLFARRASTRYSLAVQRGTSSAGRAAAGSGG